MNLFCVGLSHHTANVETRERFAGHAETDCILRNAGCAEALLLTTCNRVEVYGVSEKRVSTDEIARCLMPGAGSLSAVTDRHHNQAAPFYRYEGAKCAQHLFRVASGLDSMVVGETEILGQTKKAYERARASGAAGPYLHRLFQRAFRVAKQVRTHTEITRGSVSVGSVAVDLAQRIFGRLGSCKVLVLGAGETSERTARALVSRGVNDLRVSNRSIDRAHELARLVGGRAIPFEEWPEQCRDIDILITSTSSETPLLTSANLAPTLRNRIDRPLFIIDIAVPRDVDPKVNELDGVYLYDIDSLQSVAEQSLALRRQQIAAAETIIAEHVADFLDSIARGLNRASQTSEHPSVGDSLLRTSEL
jgi:glutamyl-tRNA reductase